MISTEKLDIQLGIKGYDVVTGAFAYRSFSYAAVYTVEKVHLLNNVMKVLDYSGYGVLCSIQFKEVMLSVIIPHGHTGQ